MNKIIKQIKDIMGDHWSSELKIEFYNDGVIVFEIYETEVPIVFNKKKEEIYLDCEFCNHHFTTDMLGELSSITKLLEDNIELLKQI